jgi:hypothetical protein
MQRRFDVTLVAALAIQVAACTGAGTGLMPARADDCKATGNDKDCTLKVIVKESQGACTVDVNLEEIEFPQSERNKIKFIFWEIDGPKGYVFPDNGIVIEKNYPIDFDKPKVKDQGRTYQWRNLHKQAAPKVYYYAINVENGDGSITCYKDPRINNR